MAWAGTEAVLDAVLAVLKAGMSAKLTTVAARYTVTPLTLAVPDTTSGYLTALIDNKQDALRDELLRLTLPSIVIMAGNAGPDGSDPTSLGGAYQTATDVIVAVRVAAKTLLESDRLLMRYTVAVNELLLAQPTPFTTHECEWAGEAIAIAEIPQDEGYLLRTRGTAFRLRSFDEL